MSLADTVHEATLAADELDRPQSGSASRTFNRVAKRGFDLLLATLLLLLAAPLLLAISAAVKLESRGPVFYRASRVGWRGRSLQVLKFRKMRQGVAGQPLTTSLDPRFTRIGHLLSKTKLDELPQLWNVVRGQMSFVGPRPESSEFVAHYADEYAEIVSVRPGITGLGQLAFSREGEILNPDDTIGHYVGAILPQKVSLDLLYARSWTFRGDLRILLWTVLPVILRMHVSVHRLTGTLTVRRRR